MSFLFIPSVIFEDWLSLQKMKITLCLISSQVRRLEELVGLLVDDLPFYQLLPWPPYHPVPQKLPLLPASQLCFLVVSLQLKHPTSSGHTSPGHFLSAGTAILGKARPQLDHCLFQIPLSLVHLDHQALFLVVAIVEKVRDVLAVAWREARVELDVPILADEVVGADFSEDEVEYVLVELAHQLDGQLVWDEEVAVGEHVRETPVQRLVCALVVVVVPQNVGNLSVFLSGWISVVLDGCDHTGTSLTPVLEERLGKRHEQCSIMLHCSADERHPVELALHHRLQWGDRHEGLA